MQTLESHFVSLSRNNLWSNYRLHRACTALQPTEYFATRASFFGSIHATLSHIYLVDVLYLDRLHMRPSSPEVTHECTTLSALTQRQREIDANIVTFCEALDSDALEKQVSYRRVNGQPYTETTSAVLSHLFLHQVHHRGQVHGLLSQTSSAPPQLDEFLLAGDLELRSAELRELGLPVV